MRANRLAHVEGRRAKAGPRGTPAPGDPSGLRATPAPITKSTKEPAAGQTARGANRDRGPTLQPRRAGADPQVHWGGRHADMGGAAARKEVRGNGHPHLI